MTLLLELCHELGGRDDGDAPEGTEVLHGLIAGHDQVGPPGCRRFQHAVIWFVGQHRHALGRVDGVGGFCHCGDERGGVIEDGGELGICQLCQSLCGVPFGGSWSPGIR